MAVHKVAGFDAHKGVHYATSQGVLPGRSYPEGLIQLGGPCTFAGAVSPNTGEPLTQHVLLGAETRCVVEAGWKGSMPLIFGWKCAIHLADFTYQVLDDRVTLLRYGEGDVDVDDFPYPDYPIIFPALRFDARDVTLDEAAQWSTLNAMALHGELVDSDSPLWDAAQPRHQFGGEPYLLNPADAEATCPLCGGSMPVFATVSDDAGVEKQPFFVNAFVQLVYFLCASCRVLTARNLAG